MEGLPQTDKECFIKQMESEVRQALSRVIDAVNAAPDGQWISASEKPVRDVMDELKRKAYETAVQMRVDSKESTFSPSEGSVGSGVVPSGYGQDKQKHKLVSVVRGNHESMGRVLARDSRVVRLPGAQEKLGLVDGAVCLRRNLEGLTLTAVGLDFFHLSEHVHGDYLECGVPEPADGNPAWVSDVLSTVKHQGYLAFWDKLVVRRNGLKGSRRKKADPGAPGHYVAQREDMIAYDKFIAKGWDIGTGPMESMCKATTRRIKGPGMRWDAENAESLMAMEALYQSNLWNAWWAQKYRRIAA